ncbi:ethanolamine ammonia-lyase subunit EutC [Evansella clarkii]|uniref:ethanolamine ammonia-lyase subunit EutC n=1 Tax=Evansella clarkii TaxID=79879 RepID=UPI000B44D151|nr:ethanolamine ammonia-lyase subunit EutC [Evansella clarkii]
MEREVIERITKMVLEKMDGKKAQLHSGEEQQVKLWNHISREPPVTAGENVIQTENPSKKIKFTKFPDEKKSFHAEREPDHRSKDKDSEPRKIRSTDSEQSSSELENLKSKTPARIGVGRAGPRPKTTTWLEFRYDHAAAVDAVFGQVNSELLEKLELFKVTTKVTHKDTYIRRPDYGRRLSDESVNTIKNKCAHKPKVQVIVSDGLSSMALNENLEDVYLSLNQALEELELETGTPFYIEKGRVAVMDHIGEILEPDVIVLLIGERPGLVSAESLSAYLCYRPRLGTIESQRQVVSNIHKGGIPPVEAGAYLGSVIEKILEYEASGVDLVKKEG